jgi:hypothetical protein
MDKDKKILDALFSALGVESTDDKNKGLIRTSKGNDSIAFQLWHLDDKKGKDAEGNAWELEVVSGIQISAILKKNNVECEKFIVSYSNSGKTPYFGKTNVHNRRYS